MSNLPVCPPDVNTEGARLRFLRAWLRLTGVAMDSAAKVRDGRTAQYEAGRARPTTSALYIKELAKLVEATPEELTAWLKEGTGGNADAVLTGRAVYSSPFAHIAQILTLLPEDQRLQALELILAKMPDG